MLLANKRIQKTTKKMHVAYFLSKNPFCKKTLRPKNRLNLEKNVTQCKYRNKKLINLKEILHRNL